MQRLKVAVWLWPHATSAALAAVLLYFGVRDGAMVPVFCAGWIACESFKGLLQVLAWRKERSRG